jgi:hypothetical protein
MVTPTSAITHRDIDDELRRLEARWQEAVALSTEWLDLPDHEQDEFSAEWPLTIDAMEFIMAMLDDGLLNACQQAELDRILAYMRVHVADIATMISEEYARLALPKE